MIPTALVDLLSAYLSALELTAANPDALLFPNADGSPLDYSNWRRRVWLPAAAAAGLKGVGFHDLRRANATAMVLDGVDMKTAQTRLGYPPPDPCDLRPGHQRGGQAGGRQIGRTPNGQAGWDYPSGEAFRVMKGPQAAPPDWR
jgi:hypothetical protein